MIQGDLIRLWPLERHDLLKNYQWANDRELARFAGMNPSPRSVLEIERWFEGVANNPEIRIFSIKTAEGDYLGNIELRELDLRCGCAEIGILLGERAWWGRGCGTEALRLLLAFAFQDLRLHRLSARVLESNPRALHCFEKCGFLREGIEREAHYQDGRFWDVHLLGLLASEWECSRPV